MFTRNDISILLVSKATDNFKLIFIVGHHTHRDCIWQKPTLDSKSLLVLQYWKISRQVTNGYFFESISILYHGELIGSSQFIPLQGFCYRSFCKLERAKLGGRKRRAMMARLDNRWKMIDSFGLHIPGNMKCCIK